MSLPSQTVDVLLVEDDAKLAQLTAEFLAQHGMAVTVAPDGARGLALLAMRRFHIVLLDLMLPVLDGSSVCIRIRREDWQTPILMLTAKGSTSDRIAGLTIGADDYLPKPYDAEELLARIRALLRRSVGIDRAHGSFQSGDLVVDFAKREVTVAGVRQALTPSEYDVLALLARSAGHVVTRKQIFDGLRGQELDQFDRTVDVHVSNLRAKIEHDPKAPRHIKTVRGLGYMLTRSPA